MGGYVFASGACFGVHVAREIGPQAFENALTRAYFTLSGGELRTVYDRKSGGVWLQQYSLPVPARPVACDEAAVAGDLWALVFGVLVVAVACGGIRLFLSLRRGG